MSQTIVQSAANPTSVQSADKGAGPHRDEAAPVVPALPVQIAAPSPDDLTRWVELLNKALPLLAVAGGAVGWLTQQPVVTLGVIGLSLVFYSLFTIVAPRVQSQLRSGLLGALVLLAGIILWLLLPLFSQARDVPTSGLNPSPTPAVVVPEQSQPPPTPSAQLLTVRQFVDVIRSNQPQGADSVEAVRILILAHACEVRAGDDLDARQDVLLFARTIHKLASYEEANNAPPLSQEIVHYLAQEQCRFKGSV
jgi:hypothetical protein